MKKKVITSFIILLRFGEYKQVRFSWDIIGKIDYMNKEGYTINSFLKGKGGIAFL